MFVPKIAVEAGDVKSGVTLTRKAMIARMTPSLGEALDALLLQKWKEMMSPIPPYGQESMSQDGFQRFEAEQYYACMEAILQSQRDTGSQYCPLATAASEEQRKLDESVTSELVVVIEQ